jgi:hypothetical protein
LWYNWAMDEEKKTEQEYVKEDQSRPHVRIFGADVDTGGGPANSKEEWQKKKEQWKDERHAHKEEWRMHRDEWRGHHRGGSFFGLIILFIGVVTLLYTMGLVSRDFWHAIAPFWPILLILWGASIMLGRHWFSRLVLFVLAIGFLLAVILYGLVKIGSPIANSLSPGVVSSINNLHPQQ